MKSKFSFFHQMLIAMFFCLASLTPLEVRADICGESVLQLGWFAAKQGRSKHINIDSLIGDNFSVKKSTDQNLLVGVGYFFDWAKSPQLRLQYGINGFYLAPTKVKGNVIQEELFTNLSYHYSITNYPIYFLAKTLISYCSHYDIVIDLGMGPNIISTRGFKERSLDGGITIPDAHLFSGKSTVSFSVTAGLGWRIINVLGNRSIEMNYRFFYLGQGGLKKVNSQVRNTLRTGNSYANALFFTITI